MRVFEHARYVHDYCIVRGQDVPEADHWLMVFLGLISDEREVLRVVQHHHVFPPYSDGYEEETASAVWIRARPEPQIRKTSKRPSFRQK